jgi:hypothetical protein
LVRNKKTRTEQLTFQRWVIAALTTPPSLRSRHSPLTSKKAIFGVNYFLKQKKKNTQKKLPWDVNRRLLNEKLAFLKDFPDLTGVVKLQIIPPSWNIISHALSSVFIYNAEYAVDLFYDGNGRQLNNHCVLINIYFSLRRIC